MKRFTIAAAALLFGASSAFGSVLNITDSGSSGGIIDTFERDGETFPSRWTPDPRATIVDCEVKFVKTRCHMFQGDYIAVRAVPRMPTSLIKFIQEGVTSRDPGLSFSYDRERFWQNIRSFQYGGNENVLNPMNTGWAQFEKVLWIDVERDADAKELLRVWEQIVDSLRKKPVGRDGLFIAIVKHPGGVESVQACWMFFAPFDPTVPKCTMVVLKKDGATFVSFTKGYYDGGYIFEPLNRFTCSVSPRQDTKAEFNYFTDLVITRFGAAPFELKTASREANNERFEFNMRKNGEASKLFEAHRELFDLRVNGYSVERKSTGSTIELSVEFTFAITKQATLDYTEITLASAQQIDYVNRRLNDLVTQNLPCVRARKPGE